MELKIKDNEISNIYLVLTHELSMAQERLSEFHKGKKGILYFRTRCSCGNWKYINRGMDYDKAYKSQTRYIKLLKNKCRQLDLESKRIRDKKSGKKGKEKATKKNKK